MNRRAFLPLAALSPLAIADLKHQSQAQVAPCVFVLAIGIAAGLITIYICKKGCEAATHCFVLQRHNKDGSWTDISKTALRMPPDRFYAAFEAWQEENDAGHIYRVREISWEEYQERTIPTGGNARPVAVPYEMK